MITTVNSQSMGLLLLVILGMFIVLGVVGFIIYKKILETDPNNTDTSLDPKITTAQEFLQFQDIKDGVIDLGAHRYRAVIECSSVNYHLKTPTEKEMIEIGYEQFINSLKFPITMFIQTRVIDSTYISKTLEQDMDNVKKKFPNLSDYMELYLDSMKNLKYYLPNTKHKKKYVIIPYEDSYLMPELTDAEKYEYSLSELRNRVDIIKRGLEGVGINCKVLDTRDVIEMVYAAYHKEHFSQDKIDALVDGDFFSLLTTGENRYSQLNSAMKMDLILNETQNKIRKDILISDDIDKSIKEKYKEIYNQLDILRDSVGGYYKEGKSKLNLYENNISRFNMETIKEKSSLVDIDEEEVKVTSNHIQYDKTNIQRLNNKNIEVPTYGKDIYEEKGFLDKYDKREIFNEEYENENANYSVAYERASIHTEQYGRVSDSEVDDDFINQPVYEESKINEYTTNNQPIRNTKKTDTKKTGFESHNTQTSTTVNTRTKKQNDSTSNVNKENIVSRNNELNKTGYHDSNISNNSIPNFEINMDYIRKKDELNTTKTLDDWDEEFGFLDDDNETPNNRTRDLSFFNNNNK